MRAIPLPDPPLTDGDILLRPWERGDVPAVTAACRDPEIPRWTVVPRRYTEENAREFIGGLDDDLAAGRQLALAAVGPGGRLLGAVGISSFVWPDLNCEIGYWTAREARGRGVASAGLRLLSRWALTDLGLERVELFAHPENAASQRVAERAGFTREGLLRRLRYRHGVREDLIIFSLLREDLGPAV
jgi:RimJ/RimL family protein N-acetyltransferase